MPGAIPGSAISANGPYGSLPRGSCCRAVVGAALVWQRRGWWPLCGGGFGLPRPHSQACALMVALAVGSLLCLNVRHAAARQVAGDIFACPVGVLTVSHSGVLRFAFRLHSGPSVLPFVVLVVVRAPLPSRRPASLVYVLPLRPAGLCPPRLRFRRVVLSSCRPGSAWSSTSLVPNHANHCSRLSGGKRASASPQCHGN